MGVPMHQQQQGQRWRDRRQCREPRAGHPHRRARVVRDQDLERQRLYLDDAKYRLNGRACRFMVKAH